jgi:(S)-sulfolactate dehydrogenase
LVDQPDRLWAELKTAQALIVRNRSQVRGDLLASAPQLKAVGRLGVGLDNIDMAACKSRQIEVFPAHGANAAAVAEYVIASILILFRKAFQSGPEMAAGHWPRTALGGNEIAGKRLGVIGYGSIGRKVCAMAGAMGMKVAAYHPRLPGNDPAWPPVEPMGFTELLAAADVISLHVPLTPETRQLIDAPAIAAMKKGAVLINTARGAVVDEKALVAALESGHLGGAAMDVFETEPVTAARGQRFKHLSNLILTPHIAGVTQESNVRVSAITAENIQRALAD